jgi:hypothetical protein
MFPIEGENNKRWEKHFNNNFPYRGVRLRLRSKGTAGLFKKAVKTKDMGVFLYATYLFVKSSVRENKSYVKSVTNYLKVRRVVYRSRTKVKRLKISKVCLK